MISPNRHCLSILEKHRLSRFDLMDRIFEWIAHFSDRSSGTEERVLALRPASALHV
jgi:hypothetical protein